MQLSPRASSPLARTNAAANAACAGRFARRIDAGVGCPPSREATVCRRNGPGNWGYARTACDLIGRVMRALRLIQEVTGRGRVTAVGQCADLTPARLPRHRASVLHVLALAPPC